MKSMKDIVEYYLKEESEEFAKWAFGEKFNEFTSAIEFMKAWNERHSSLLTLDGDGNLTKDIKKMIEIFKEKR